MGTVSVSLPSDGTTADVSDYNTPITTIVDELNGNLENTNIATSAAIDASKLSGGVSGMFGSWTSYTPTITLNGGTSTNGNATITGNYIEIGKTVHFRISYVIGSTTSFTGLTSINFSLPVSAATDYADPSTVVTGNAKISGSYFLLGSIFVSSSTFQLIGWNAAASSGLSASAITSSFPGAWAVGSTWFISGTYEAA